MSGIKLQTCLWTLLLLELNLLQGQPWLIQGSIEDAAEGPILLASYYGDRFTLLDSTTSGTGSFYFVLGEDTPPGIFRIIYAQDLDSVRNQNRFVEFIFNHENINLVISSSETGPVPYFDNSLENRVYHEFMDFELTYEAEVMAAYGQLYPSWDGADTDVVDRYDELQRGREVFMDSISGLYPDLYAVRLMNAFRAPFIPGEIAHVERIDTLKACFFDRAPIDDPALLYAPVYSFKLIDYLSLYKDLNLTGEEQEMAFIEAVDRIMVKVAQEEQLRAFVVGYLLEGFEMLDMEQVQLHLADNYLDETCETDLMELVKSRMEGYRKMVPGKSAPDIIIRDVKGITCQLSELDHPYVLVLFWASTCEHCRDMLPALRDWYLNENTFDLEVLSISIDSSEANFSELIGQLDLPWINARDPQGWQGKAPSDYHVYATPTLYLLDRERSIVARPSSFRQFLRALKKLED